MDLGLKGKVALVAGASQGMGRATALSFSREGAKVSICARGETALNEAAEMIRKETGGEVLSMVADMTQSGGHPEICLQDCRALRPVGYRSEQRRRAASGRIHEVHR